MAQTASHAILSPQTQMEWSGFFNIVKDSGEDSDEEFNGKMINPRVHGADLVPHIHHIPFEELSETDDQERILERSFRRTVWNFCVVQN
jgi:hypothetical protein